MKTISISLLCFFYWGLVNAQIVNIPDTNFKDQLINHDPVIDTNGDDEIQVSEAENFTGTIEVSGTPSTPEGIANVTGLEAFINSIGFSASFNDITSIDFSSNLLIENITINENPLTQINVSQNQNLRTFSVSGSALTSLDISNKPDLLLAQANFAQITSLNVSNCPSLQFLYVQNNDIETVNLDDLASLVILNISDNPVEALRLENSPLLTSLLARNASIRELDLSNNSDLFQVGLTGNSLLTYINLKNGDNEGLIIDGGSNSSAFENMPLLDEVCVDDVTNNLAAFIQSQTTQTVNFSKVCELNTPNIEAHIRIAAYPNPATNFIHLESNEVLESITLFDIQGRLLNTYQPQKTNTKIALENHPKGVYFLKLKTQTNQLEYVQFIKQ